MTSAANAARPSPSARPPATTRRNWSPCCPAPSSARRVDGGLRGRRRPDVDRPAARDAAETCSPSGGATGRQGRYPEPRRRPQVGRVARRAVLDRSPASINPLLRGTDVSFPGTSGFAAWAHGHRSTYSGRSPGTGRRPGARGVVSQIRLPSQGRLGSDPSVRERGTRWYPDGSGVEWRSSRSCRSSSPRAGAGRAAAAARLRARCAPTSTRPTAAPRCATPWRTA